VSEFLYVVGKGTKFREDLEDELVEDIRKSFSGIYPHTFIERIRVIARDAHGDVLIEPLNLHGKVRGDILAHIVYWLAERAERVVVRLEGHRGSNALPDLEQRTGTIDDVLRFRQRRPDPYLVEYEIS